MARQSMVTRTIAVTKVNVMCLNIETAEPFNKELTLSGTYKDEKAIQKAAEKVINTDIVKAVHVVDYEENEILYGMTEQEFIGRAQILPPRTAKKAE